MGHKTIAIYYEQYGYGGVDTHMASLINNWPSSEDRFIIMTNPKNAGLEFLKSRLRTETSSIIIIALGCGFSFRFVRALYSIRPDVLISNNGGYPGGLSCSVAALLGRIFMPKMRTVLLIHHGFWEKRNLYLLRAHLLALLVRLSKASVVTVSQASRDILRKKQTPFGDIDVIQNGVEEAPAHAKPANLRSRYAIDNSTVLIGMIGPIDPHKGHSLIIETFRISSLLREKAHLIIVGEGETALVDELKKLISDANIVDIVTFTGFLKEDSYAIIREFDILAMPTSDFEAFGYSLAEAMACSIPVIASRAGAMADIIEDEKSGLLFDCQDTNGLRTELETLVGDAELRRQIGQNGRRRIREKFPAAKMAQEYYEMVS